MILKKKYGKFPIIITDINNWFVKIEKGKNTSTIIKKDLNDWLDYFKDMEGYTEWVDQKS